MSKPNTNLENLIPSRIASRTAAAPVPDSPPEKTPVAVGSGPPAPFASGG